MGLQKILIDKPYPLGGNGVKMPKSADRVKGISQCMHSAIVVRCPLPLKQ